ncbi:DNA mismatch repair protein MutT [Lentzea sp. NBRC 105346]|nr:DNA mismatch repair protein MutT [Lentzea sp. NBRC 105346]
MHVRDGRLLVVRSRHKQAFYLPGGKIEPGETLEAALRREVAEELGVRLREPRLLRRYVAPAYGEGEGAMVDMTCFTADLDGEPRPCGEIAELSYVTAAEYAAHDETAPAIHEVLADLA